MAGKEYKAKAKTVQKMSRDGLMEEDLRTGRAHKVVTGRVDAIRIGDRPMEPSARNPEEPESSTGRHGMRLDRSGTGGADIPADGSWRGTDSGTPRGFDQEASSSGRKMKRRMTKAGEPSYGETPSSLQENAVDDSSIYADAAKEEAGQIPDGKIRAEEALRHSTYSKSLRQGRGAASFGGQKGIYGLNPEDRSSIFPDDPAGSSRRKRMQQQRYALNQRESTFHEGVEADTASAPDTRNSSLYSGNEQTTASSPDSAGEDPSTEDTDPGRISEESRRLHNIRGHPSGSPAQAAGYIGGLRHEPSGKRDMDHEASVSPKGSRLRETSAELDGLDSIREEVRSKRKRERLNQEQRKSRDPSRISFEDGNGMVKGSGAGFRRTGKAAAGLAVGTTARAAGTAGHIIHAKAQEAADEDDNSAAQASLHAESAAEMSIRSLASRNIRRSGRRASAARRKSDVSAAGRLLFEEKKKKRAAGAAKTEAEKRAAVKKFFRKQRQRKLYAAARKEEKTIETIFREQQSFVSRAASIVRDAIVRNSRVFLMIGIAGIVFLLIAASLGSCTALVQGAGHTVISTTYPSTDEDIYAVENRYRELEAGLDAQINRMQQTHPTYDEFRFQIDEITHNPYHLISYFTTKYGQFTYEQVKDELEEIFREQYTLTTTGEEGITITETRTVHPGDSLGEVTTSGYCSCEICCGPYAGGPTASGVYPVSNHTIAVDAYNPFVPMGTHIIMNGVEYVVEDTGAFDRFGVQFDVYYDDHQTALTHGHQVWEAYLAEGGGIQELELTTTRTVNRMSVVLTNNDLDTVLQNRMTEDEKVRYGLYNLTFGNRDYLFDLNNLPKYGNASRGYTVPPEALSDERFARMIAEAERHLGTPYVWGGYAPGGFDCSGFVSWVINHCGNGWDIGRQTAEGIRQLCYYVPPEDARPGDIVFFEHTYDTAGASHVGIYVGDGMMIHCGEPVQYTSINTSYWQDHFMEFGRLP